MIEHEIKFRIKSPKAIVARLTELEAADLGRRKELDIYLGRGGRGVRVRKFGRDGLVTVKRVVRSGGEAKVREETETRVDDVDSLIKILKTLGFEEQKRKEKVRHAFKLRNTLVLVDRIPFLGYFVEIEGPSLAALKRTARALDLDPAKASSAGYEDLFLAHYVRNAGSFGKTDVTILPTFASEKAWKEKNRLPGKKGRR